MTRLHIGCGSGAIPGWVNLDIAMHPGVDRVLDVREGLPYREVEAIFAEHFLEHLTLAEAMRFLRDCRTALREDGVLRLSTPNLDWVWLTHYRDPATLSGAEAWAGCLEMNRAFHGWGHRFLYNLTVLTRLLQSSGFRDVVRCEYGASAHRLLAGLEKHERAADHAHAVALLIVEASGVQAPDGRFEADAAEYLRDFEVK